MIIDASVDDIEAWVRKSRRGSMGGDRDERMSKFYKAVKAIRELTTTSTFVDRETRHLSGLVADALSALDDELAAVEAAARDSK